MSVEKEIIKAKINNAALVPTILLAVAIDVIMFTYAMATGEIFLEFYVIPAIAVLVVLVGVKKFTLSFVKLTLTDRRVYGKTGIINTKSVDSPIGKINSVSIEQDFWAKVFNYSTILISTSSGNYKFKFIKDAERFKEKTMEQIELHENEKLKKQAAALAESMTK